MNKSSFFISWLVVFCMLQILMNIFQVTEWEIHVSKTLKIHWDFCAGEFGVANSWKYFFMIPHMTEVMDRSKKSLSVQGRRVIIWCKARRNLPLHCWEELSKYSFMIDYCQRKMLGYVLESSYMRQTCVKI